MTEHSDSFAYTISESALAKIAATAALGTKGVAGKKRPRHRRQISGRHRRGRRAHSGLLRRTAADAGPDGAAERRQGPYGDG